MNETVKEAIIPTILVCLYLMSMYFFGILATIFVSMLGMITFVYLSLTLTYLNIVFRFILDAREQQDDYKTKSKTGYYTKKATENIKPINK